MTKELTITPSKEILEVGNRIDTIVNECLPVAVQESQNFVQALTLASGIKELRQIFLTDSNIKETVEAMQNTHLGFMTDRTPSAVYKSKQAKEKGKELKPYRYEDVAEVCIEAMLKGYRLTNNEFNMIAKRFYAAKNGKFRRIQEFDGVTDFQFTTTTPTYEPKAQDGRIYAKVQGYASWHMAGTLVTLGSSASAEDRLIFKIRVNNFMGEDAIVGKALSKLFSRVLMRLEGKIMPESTDIIEDGDVVDAEFDGDKPEHTGSASDLTEKIKQKGSEAGAGETKDQKTEEDIPETGGANPGADAAVSDNDEKSYYDKEFKGIRANFEGKLRNHIKNGKIKEATEADFLAIRAKWASNQDTKDTPCPLDDKTEAQCTCPPGGINEGDEMKVKWCIASCSKFSACDVAKEGAIGAGLWNPEDLS
ncbi:hypothetical protein KAR91_55265 [Candidatus Pacearchaeota archaeon]|nr:hypothetical protein [Candidatus Pacearchaeota archaeon]